MQGRVVAVMAAVVIAGLGAALGVSLAGSSAKTTNRLVTVGGRAAVRARTVTEVRTVERVRTTVRTVAARAPSAPASVGSVTVQGGFSPGAPRTKQFAGTGAHVLGTIIVEPPGTTLRWTASGGRFRLLFNGTGVAADSTARGGQIAVPPLTYQQVTVETAGRWTVRIG
jgi:hypothetical protein